MKGKLFAKLVSVAIAIAMLTSLASVSLAESGEEEPEIKVFIVSFNMERYIKYVETEDGTPVKKPDIKPEREGYVFSYWFVKGDIYQEPYDFNLPVTGSLKLEPLYLLLAPAADSHDEDDTNTDETTKEVLEVNPEDLSNLPDEPPAALDPDEPPVDSGSEGSPNDPEPGNPPADSGSEGSPDDPEPDNPPADSDPEDPDSQNPASEDPDAEDDDVDDDENEEEDDDHDDADYELDKTEEVTLPERSIRIWTDAPAEVEEGYLITLQSELTGYEDCILSLRWQYSTDGGETWQDAIGGTGYTYTYAASVELSQCFWHLRVAVIQEPLD